MRRLKTELALVWFEALAEEARPAWVSELDAPAVAFPATEALFVTVMALAAMPVAPEAMLPVAPAVAPAVASAVPTVEPTVDPTAPAAPPSNPPRAAPPPPPAIGGAIGGGTPTVLSAEQLSELIGHLKAKLPFSEDAEIEMEVHPLTADRKKLESLRKDGVTRISFGVQSFNDDMLRLLGAPHQASDAYRAIELAQELGFPKVGLDLLFGKPGETVADLIADIEAAMKLEIGSISCYRLRVAPHTSIAKRAAKLKLLDRHAMYDLWEAAVKSFTSGGYHQYGATDFARPGGESEYYHGFCRAPQRETLSFGVGCISYLNGPAYVNIHNLKDYMETVGSDRLPGLMGKQLTAAEAMSRYLVLGARAVQVNKTRFRELFGFGMEDVYSDQLQYLAKQGLIINGDDVLQLTTPKGTFYVNNVCTYFFTPNNWRKPQPLRFELINVETPALTKESILQFCG